jgi:nicotinamidase-related amidase
MRTDGVNAGNTSAAKRQENPQVNGRNNMLRLNIILPLAALLAVLIYAAPAPAQTIIDEWSSIKAPPAPELKTVTVEPKTTALLVMDLIKQACNEKNRPRCIASIPKVEKLLAEARAKGVFIVYTIFPSPSPSTFPNPVIGDTLPAVAPKGDEPVIVSFVDKFILRDKDTGLEKILRDKGITTVITVGTATHGAVLYTSSAASLRGFNVIVPVDGMSGNGQITFDEQAVAYLLTSAPIVSPKITLTRIDMIKFGN